MVSKSASPVTERNTRPHYSRTNKALAFLGVVLVVIAVSIVFSPELFQRKTPIGGDIIYLNFPRMTFVNDSLKAGEAPLWAPFVYGGYPLAAEGQSGVFYPVTPLLSGVPREFIVSVSTMLHVLIAGTGMFVFARLMGVSFAGSLLAAFAFAFNGFLLIRVQHVNVFRTIAWAPWMFAMMECIAKDGGKKAFSRAPLAAAVAALIMMVLHPQFALYAVAGAVFFFFFSVFRNRMPAGRALAALALFAFLSLAISAVQLIPLYELSGYAVRSGKSGADFFFAGSLHPKMLLTMLFPHIWGAPWDATFRAGMSPAEVMNYMGILPFVLAIFAVPVKESKGVTMPFIIMAVCSVLFSLGSFLPGGGVLYHIPLLNSFRVPARDMFFAALSLSFLSGVGLDVIMRRRGVWKGRFAEAAAKAFLVFAAVGGAAALAGALFKPRVVAALYSKFGAIAGGAHSDAFYAEKIRLLFGMAMRNALFAALACGAVALLLIAARNGKKQIRVFAVAMAVALSFADLALVSADYIERTGRSVLNHRPGVLKSIRDEEKRAGFFRVCSQPTKEYLSGGKNAVESVSTSREAYERNFDTLDYELPLAYKVYSINGYGSMPLWNFQLLVKKGKSVSLTSDRSGYRVFTGAEKNAGELDPANETDAAALRILDIGYLIRPSENEDRMALYPVRKREDAAGKASPFSAVCGGRSVPLRDVSWSRPHASEISAEVNMPCGGALAFSERYYPGWSAYLKNAGDERPVKVEESPDSGMSVRLDRGRHKVVFVFEPRAQKIGLTISLVALAMAMAGTLCLSFVKNKAE